MAEIYLTDEEMNYLISHLPGVRARVRRTAYEGASRAEAILDAHRSSNTHHARITVTHGDVDSFVNLDDTESQSAAAAIEYGRKKRGVTSGIHAIRSAF